MAKTTNKETGTGVTTEVTKKKVAKKKVAKKKVVKKAAAEKSAAKKVAAKKTAPTEAPVTKKTGTKKKAATRASAAKRAPAGQITIGERHRLIAEAAFLRSESQGFRGNACDDWLHAEAEIDARLSRDGIKVVG